MGKSTHTAEYAALRAKLAAIRQTAALSQRAVAEKLGVPHSWVAKIESGERRIDLVEFAWFCAACGTSPAQEAAALFASFGASASRPRGRGRGRR